MVPPASSTSAGTNSAFSVTTRPFFSIMVQRSFFFFIGTRAGTARARKVFGFCAACRRACARCRGAAPMCGVCAAGPALRCRAGPPCSLVLLYHGPFFCYTIHTAKMDVCANYACIPAYRSRPKEKGGRRTRHRPPGKGGTQGGQRHAACPAAGEKLTEPVGCTGMRPRPQPARQHTPGSTGCRRSCSFPARAGAAKSAGPSPQYPAQPSRCWAAARSF